MQAPVIRRGAVRNDGPDHGVTRAATSRLQLLLAIGAIVAPLTVLAGCGGSACACGKSKHLFVPNLDANTITSYPLTTRGGNVAPSATISANNGSLEHPANEVFDSNGDLWVGNETSNTIVEFTPGQLTRSGSPVPHVTISANNGSLDSPEPTAFDAKRDLWVANARNNTIVEFTRAQLARSGSPVPQVTISAKNGSLINPFVITFDRAGNLWVTNRRANNIVEFTPAQLARSGSPVPKVTIAAKEIPTTAVGTLYYPYTPLFDSSGNLWVSNQFGDTIVMYTPAQLKTSGSPIPNITIRDNDSSLTGPVGSVLDSSGDLWVVNYKVSKKNFEYAIVKYTSAQRAASGNPKPVVTISGANTGLKYPVGAAIGP